MTEHEDVIRFWFSELKPKEWWVKSAELDGRIRERFGECHQAACRCELSTWRETAKGRLAEVIVLDQFSRNIYRDRPEAFAQDAQALTLSQEAVRVGADKELSVTERAFLYMPYMHSESLIAHEQALLLFDQPGLEYNLDFERKHKAIIDRFGRYPHRNQILGRPSSETERQFLAEPGSSF